MSTESKHVARLRDDMLDLLEKHEQRCSDEACVFKENLIAFLAHGIGLTSAAQINRMESLLDQYNQECPHCTRAN